jgi:hypothetical protein
VGETEAVARRDPARLSTGTDRVGAVVIAGILWSSRRRFQMSTQALPRTTNGIGGTVARPASGPEPCPSRSRYYSAATECDGL